MEHKNFSVPDDVYFLCMLHNIGTTRPDRSLTLEEIARWTALDPNKVRESLQKLIETNYVQAILSNGIERYHVTVNGIRKVLSMYS